MADIIPSWHLAVEPPYLSHIFLLLHTNYANSEGSRQATSYTAKVLYVVVFDLKNPPPPPVISMVMQAHPHGCHWHSPCHYGLSAVSVPSGAQVHGLLRFRCNDVESTVMATRPHSLEYQCWGYAICHHPRLCHERCIA